MRDSARLTGRLFIACAVLCAGVTAASASERIFYYHNDHLGTPQAMTDPDGRVVWQAEYRPFGAASLEEDPDGDGKPTTNNQRFPGQYFDAETGLHYNWHRYYEPETGRYLQPDPTGIREGRNHLYVYVSNNPVSLIDPKGLEAQLCYSPVETKLLNVIGARHASVKARCRGRDVIRGFHPLNFTWENRFYGPGQVLDDSGRSGLTCSGTGMTECVDEECVCRMMVSFTFPYFGVAGRTCHQWAREVIARCRK